MSKFKLLNLSPIQVTGIVAVQLGTLAWAITLIVLLISRSWLDETGRANWIWIAVSGIILGLLGFRYTTRRAKHLGLTYSTRLFGSKSKEPDQSQLVQDFE
jgi:TRAP-type C4-dicarboxylate transport system permease small subunit